MSRHSHGTTCRTTKLCHKTASCLVPVLVLLGFRRPSGINTFLARRTSCREKKSPRSHNDSFGHPLVRKTSDYVASGSLEKESTAKIVFCLSTGRTKRSREDTSTCGCRVPSARR
ncbi:hypothetical protein V1478_001209 [Vespula squamosa]|uniref:Secreted protein n=1 Tax=Vespula squamosa TaxID=30214 RepID=A0ABD2C7N7_VESSQ